MIVIFSMNESICLSTDLSIALQAVAGVLEGFEIPIRRLYQSRFLHGIVGRDLPAYPRGLSKCLGIVSHVLLAISRLLVRTHIHTYESCCVVLLIFFFIIFFFFRKGMLLLRQSFDDLGSLPQQHIVDAFLSSCLFFCLLAAIIRVLLRWELFASPLSNRTQWLTTSF